MELVAMMLHITFSAFGKIAVAIKLSFASNFR